MSYLTLSGRRGSRGLTLIELMISMALGLFLIAGAIQVLMSSKQTYQLNRDLSWMQENARFAIDLLTNDIRMAGYWGCNSGSTDSSLSNTLNDGGEWYTGFGNAINGYDGDQAAFPTTEFPEADVPTLSSGTLPKSDVMIVYRGDGDGELIVDSHNPNSAVISVVGSHSYSKGRVLVVSNCTKTAIFQTTGGNTIKLGHNSGNSVSPGNCTKMFRFPVVCSNSNQPGNPAYDFDADGQAKVMAAIANAYYIDTASSGLPVLYRKALGSGSSIEGGIFDEQLSQGIESIQMTYGEDVDALDVTEDTVANRFVTADNVSDWGKVVAVKLHILARSLSEVSSEPQTFRFVGNEYTADDNYLRQEFMSTVKIRNRG